MAIPRQMGLLPSCRTAPTATYIAQSKHYPMGPQKQGHEAQPAPSGWGVPRSTAGPVLPITQKQGGGTEKLLSHRFPLQVKALKGNFSETSGFPMNLISPSDSIHSTAVTLRNNSCCSKINSKREKQVGEQDFNNAFLVKAKLVAR